MLFDEAYARLSKAGRELGSGPAHAATWLLDFDSNVKLLTDRSCPVNNARAIVMGAAIGLVMAEDPTAMAALDNIERKWRENH